MKKLVTAVFVVLALAGAAFASDTDQLDKATNVLDEVMATPEKGIPHDLLNRAVCVGIVPSEIKAAFVVGGSYGRGVFVCRQHGNGAWAAPAFFRMEGASVGWQIGGRATDIVLLVMNESGVRKLLGDKVKLGADATVAAGPVGREAQAATDVELHTEILSYSRSRGLFAGVSLSGNVIRPDHDADQLLYGRPIHTREILFGDVRIPSAARPLDGALERFSPRGGTAYRATRASLND